jgi:hypothetical protein
MVSDVRGTAEHGSSSTEQQDEGALQQRTVLAPRCAAVCSQAALAQSGLAAAAVVERQLCQASTTVEWQ